MKQADESLFGGTAKTISYDYDQSGNLIKTTYPDGDEVHITREGLGRINDIKINTDLVAVEYQYVGAQVAQRKYPTPDVKYEPQYGNFGRATDHRALSFHASRRLVANIQYILSRKLQRVFWFEEK